MQFVVAMAAVGEGVLCSVVEFLALVDGVELPGPMLQQALGHGLAGFMGGRADVREGDYIKHVRQWR